MIFSCVQHLRIQVQGHEGPRVEQDRGQDDCMVPDDLQGALSVEDLVDGGIRYIGDAYEEDGEGAGDEHDDGGDRQEGAPGPQHILGEEQGQNEDWDWDWTVDHTKESHAEMHQDGYESSLKHCWLFLGGLEPHAEGVKESSFTESLGHILMDGIAHEVNFSEDDKHY